ncbi:MAG: ABC transporter substrate-binding protein, partial [Acidobacteriota bacterium]
MTVGSAIGGPVVRGCARAAGLYFDELNAAGGIDGTPVDLVVYEYDVDLPAGAQPEEASAWGERVRAAARERAQDIVQGNAWLVIGPGDSISANAVAEELGGAESGPILAGITPTATAVEVTAGHPGYFRTAPSTRAEGRVLAHYMLRVVDMDQVVVLKDPADDYATAFSDDFVRPFTALGGELDVELFEDSAAREVDVLLGNRLFRPDAIVLALQPPAAAAAIAELRRRGATLPIVGGDSLVGERFHELLQQEPEERAQPGVFSDGVYAASPFLFDTADAAGRRFRQSYLQRYGEEPGWGAATTHDAALVATEAIRSALRSGSDSATVDGRAAVLAYLQGLTDAEAPRGLLGPVVFDSEGDPPDRVWITRMHGNRQLSAPVQLVPAGRVADNGELPEDLGSEVLAVGGRYMRKARVVYTGMDFNQISNFDGLGGYTADFYLWFRYRDVDPAVDGIGPADIADVELLEVAEGTNFALSEEPLESRRDGGMRYELYRIKADFNNAFDFHDYPFDRQAIEISLRNRTLTRDR